MCFPGEAMFAFKAVVLFIFSRCLLLVPLSCNVVLSIFSSCASISLRKRGLVAYSFKLYP